MASPFRAFRRYQKAMLVVAGVVLMFVFVIGDPLMQYVGGGRSGRDGGTLPGQVAVTWDGGELTNSELSHLVFQRLVVNDFLRNVEYVGRSAAYEAGVEPTPLRVEMIAGPERPQQGVEQDVVRTRIFAQAARKAGMRISDDYMVEYLRQLGRGYVTVDVIRQIIAQMQSSGRPITDAFILDALREEMLSRNFLSSYAFSLDTLMPQQRWQDWLRVNDRVVLEAAAVPVESFVVDVPDPTEAELTAFYDQYKNREPQPERAAGVEFPSPTPGFARPRKVELQYLVADFNSFLTKVENDVTDAEIEEFYEKNKDPYFISPDSTLLDTTGQPASDNSAVETGDTEAAEQGDPTVPADKPATAPGDGDQSSLESKVNGSVFRLVSFQQDEDSDSEAAPSGETAPPAASETTESGLQVSDAFPTDPTDEAAAEPQKFQPLDEVRDEIRRQIAEAKVNDQLIELMSELERELNDRYTAYFGKVLDAEGSGEPIPPAPENLADLSDLSQKYGLEFKRTEPLSFLELRELPIGMSAQSAAGNLPLIASVFGREMELYQPVTTFDLDNNRYVVMKSSDTPGSVPKLDEIRDEVVQAYKMQKAADLALAHAKDLAKKAQDSGASLEQFFENDSNVKVVKTDPFSYLTIGNISRDSQQVQSFRLSKPEGIDAAGPDFMQTVFNLGDGEVAAVLNHDHTQAYVVRVAEHVDSEAKLRLDFLAEATTWYGIPAMGRDHAQVAVGVLLRDMLSSANVDWKRPPDSNIAERSDEEAADES